MVNTIRMTISKSPGAMIIEISWNNRRTFTPPESRMTWASEYIIASLELLGLTITELLRTSQVETDLKFLVLFQATD